MLIRWYKWFLETSLLEKTAVFKLIVQVQLIKYVIVVFFDQVCSQKIFS